MPSQPSSPLTRLVDGLTDGLMDRLLVWFFSIEAARTETGRTEEPRA